MASLSGNLSKEASAALAAGDIVAFRAALSRRTARERVAANDRLLEPLGSVDTARDNGNVVPADRGVLLEHQTLWERMRASIDLPVLARLLQRPVLFMGAAAAMGLLLLTGLCGLWSRPVLRLAPVPRPAHHAFLRAAPYEPPVPPSEAASIPERKTRPHREPPQPIPVLAASIRRRIEPAARPVNAPSQIAQVTASPSTPPPNITLAPARVETPSAAPVQVPRVQAEAAIVPAVAVARVSSSQIFSAQDAEVTPPELIVSRRAEGDVRDGRSNAQATIEVIVNERGDVESVKTTVAPRSIAESMLLAINLHAVKSWQFRPALRDGQPVKYRQRMTVDGLAAQGRHP